MPTDQDLRAYNDGVIAEFRANHGLVAQPEFPIVLLTTAGVRSGVKTTTPVARGVDGQRVFVVASKAGGPTHPAWYFNLQANPAVMVELGDNSYRATARVVRGEERDRLYELICEQVPLFREYAGNTERVFPVVVLDGVPAPRAA